MANAPEIKIATDVTLPVVVFKEDDAFVAYTPALDLSTCGDTYEEAQRNFHEAVTLFFAECVSRGTLEDALASLGWRKTGKPSDGWVPPQVVGHFDAPVPAIN